MLRNLILILILMVHMIVNMLDAHAEGAYKDGSLVNTIKDKTHQSNKEVQSSMSLRIGCRRR